MCPLLMYSCLTVYTAGVYVQLCYCLFIYSMLLCTLQVMAGTGNLEVLRLCRHLRSRVGVTYAYVLYGSHMAISMSLGLLFMGGGRWVLAIVNWDIFDNCLKIFSL